ncbi:very short patch repair endonuclease [Paludisphaera sp.]|uniref:very short patch repair endonuclease n=1 Tax=Paludisphaera sp. TaxID=2017432 RepID=UPI00301C26CB
MADSLTPEERSKQMGLVRSTDTKPEMVVRRLVHSLGYRYRLHDRTLPGKPDLVFKRRRKVIFIHGCFWHRHGAGCSRTRMPKSRQEFWGKKLTGNEERDRRNEAALSALGWTYLIVWECQLKDRDEIARRVRDFLG